jgi:hypothetical protein
MKTKMDLRAFLKKTTQAALNGLGGAGPVLQGCVSKKNFDLLVNPYQYPVGIESMIVNGQVAIEHAEHTDLPWKSSQEKGLGG